MKLTQYKREQGLTTRKRRDARQARKVNAGWMTRIPPMPMKWRRDEDSEHHNDLGVAYTGQLHKSMRLTGRKARRANGLRRHVKAGFQRRNRLAMAKARAGYLQPVSPEPNRQRADDN